MPLRRGVKKRPTLEQKSSNLEARSCPSSYSALLPLAHTSLCTQFWFLCIPFVIRKLLGWQNQDSHIIKSLTVACTGLGTKHCFHSMFLQSVYKITNAEGFKKQELMTWGMMELLPSHIYRNHTGGGQGHDLWVRLTWVWVLDQACDLVGLVLPLMFISGLIPHPCSTCLQASVFSSLKWGL